MKQLFYIDRDTEFTTELPLETIEPYRVYVKVDNDGRIIAINSSAFLSSLEGWQEIDSGYDDKYYHAQGNYFEKSLCDDYNIYRYKLVNGAPVERTQEEINADYIELKQAPSQLDIIEAQITYTAMMTNTLLEA